MPPKVTQGIMIPREARGEKPRSQEGRYLMDNCAVFCLPHQTTKIELAPEPRTGVQNRKSGQEKYVAFRQMVIECEYHENLESKSKLEWHGKGVLHQSFNPFCCRREVLPSSQHRPTDYGRLQGDECRRCSFTHLWEKDPTYAMSCRRVEGDGGELATIVA